MNQAQVATQAVQRCIHIGQCCPAWAPAMRLRAQQAIMYVQRRIQKTLGNGVSIDPWKPFAPGHQPHQQIVHSYQYHQVF